LPAASHWPRNQLWPGWFRDQQLAAEHAQQLASRLGAAVNATLLAQGWLDEYGTTAKASRQQRGQQQRRQPAPRQYLNTAGVTAAIYAVLASLLAVLWAAAWDLGWASAIAVLGLGTIDSDVAALEDLIREGKHRLDGMVQTRVSRAERALLAARHDGATVDQLAQQLGGILSSPGSALLVTQTETTWASGWAAYNAYLKAGVQWVTWRSRRDGLVCPICLGNDQQGAIRIGQRFKSGDRWPPSHPRCRCCLLPSGPPKTPPSKGGGT